MSGCLVGLAWNMMVALLTAIFRLMCFLLLVMVTAISSLFVGVDVAVDRIANSWIEQTAGRGLNIGYNPTARNGMRVGAVALLIVGWILSIGVVVLIVRLFGS